MHDVVSTLKGSSVGPLELIMTEDRPTDDFRYAIDNKKINALGWAPGGKFEEQLILTVSWYLQVHARKTMDEVYAEQRPEAKAKL